MVMAAPARRADLGRIAWMALLTALLAGSALLLAWRGAAAAGMFPWVDGSPAAMGAAAMAGLALLALLALLGLWGLWWGLARRRAQRDHLTVLLAQAWPGRLEMAPDGSCLAANEAAAAWMGMSADALEGRCISEFFPWTPLPGQAGSQGAGVLRATLRHCDGGLMDMDLCGLPLGGGRWQLYLKAQDLPDAVAGRTRPGPWFEHAGEAAVLIGMDGRITESNPAFGRLTGYGREEAVGLVAKSLLQPAHDAVALEQIGDALNRDEDWAGELWLRRKDGRALATWTTVSTLPAEAGRGPARLALITDISAIKHAEHRLEELAHQDALTKLPNRRLFNQELERALARARRHGERLALLFVDLDHFKQINDRLGHAAGDALLQEVARRLQGSVRVEDSVARLGGDEFTVLLDKVSGSADAEAMARKIIETVTAPIELDGQELTISPSIGIAFFPEDADDMASLIRAADAAMYRAKQDGRSTLAFFGAGVVAAASERQGLQAELRLAIERGELLLLYQPQFDLRRRQVLGVEAMLRWQHPRLGLLGPERFAELAEQAGLMADIDRWILRSGCAQARAWRDAGLMVCVWLTLSARRMLQAGLARDLAEALPEQGSDREPALIGLQIGARLQQSLARSEAPLRHLRALGVRLAVADFSTGWASLGLEQPLPIDSLKIAPLLVSHLSGDQASQPITAAMISMSHALGLEVVAEGVQTESQLEILRRQGCDHAQGPLLAEPLPAEAALQLMRRHARPNALQAIAPERP